MAKDSEEVVPPKKEGEETVSVPMSVLADIQERLSKGEQAQAELEAKNAGLESMLAETQGAASVGEPKLREKKSFEPKFRTVRLRKYPIAGDETNPGYIVGWTSKGAYQEVDRTGVSPQVVDYIDVIFLDHEKTPDGKIKAEKIRLLDMYNKGIQVHCKILETKREDKLVPTNEEIDVTVFDPQHGLIATGDKIDGYVTMSDIQYKVSIPEKGEQWVDAIYCN